MEDKDSDDRTTAASLSAGMVMCASGDAFSGAYNKADKALYLVKQNGKDGFCFYVEDPDSCEDEPLDLNRLVSGIRIAEKISTLCLDPATGEKCNLCLTNQQARLQINSRSIAFRQAGVVFCRKGLPSIKLAQWQPEVRYGF